MDQESRLPRVGWKLVEPVVCPALVKESGSSEKVLPRCATPTAKRTAPPGRLKRSPRRVKSSVRTTESSISWVVTKTSFFTCLEFWLMPNRSEEHTSEL